MQSEDHGEQGSPIHTPSHVDRQLGARQHRIIVIQVQNPHSLLHNRDSFILRVQYLYNRASDKDRVHKLPLLVAFVHHHVVLSGHGLDSRLLRDAEIRSPASRILHELRAVH